jgi:hypothetical protein
VLLPPIDEPFDGGDHDVFDVDQLHAHPRRTSVSFVLLARPYDAPEGGPGHQLARNLNFKGESFADSQRVVSADEQAASPQVQGVCFDMVSGGTLVGDAYTGEAGAGGAAAFLGHGRGRA